MSYELFQEDYVKPIRYKQAMVDEFLKEGYWTQELFYDFWERNAREYGDREALVDSKYRVTWSEAKKLVDAIAYTWVKMEIPRSARIIIQSPNSVYGFLARIAAERAGLISLTVYPYLRERELTYMVERTEAAAVVILHEYRQCTGNFRKNFPIWKRFSSSMTKFRTVPRKAPIR